MREAVEKFYITNALSFITGYAVVVVLRDLSTITANAIDNTENAIDVSFTTEAVLVVLFGPLLTIGLLFTKVYRP